MGKLTALGVARLKKPGLHGDGAGLYLQIANAGSRSWSFRYRLAGRDRQMGLGPYPALSLADARSKAANAKRLVLDGIDPIENRKSERMARITPPTFESCAERFIDSQKVGWQSAKHIYQWEATLSTYAMPHIGELPVDLIQTHHITDVLEPIWTTKTETASRLRGRLEAILDWAKVRGYRDGENPARWRGHLDKLLPKRSKVAPVRPRPALPYPEIPEFVKKISSRQGSAVKALEFVILTAVRSGEVRLATWDELDLEAKVWTIPAARMKSRKEHRVPLSNAAVRIATAQRELSNSKLVFPGHKVSRPLSDMSLIAVLRRMRMNDITVHGFRSTFRDWAGEQTNFPREIAEAALAHGIASKVEAADRRGDALEKRRLLMDAWASYCTTPPAAAEVVRLKRR